MATVPNRVLVVLVGTLVLMTSATGVAAAATRHLEPDARRKVVATFDIDVERTERACGIFLGMPANSSHNQVNDVLIAALRSSDEAGDTGEAVHQALVVGHQNGVFKGNDVRVEARTSIEEACGDAGVTKPADAPVAAGDPRLCTAIERVNDAGNRAAIALDDAVLALVELDERAQPTEAEIDAAFDVYFDKMTGAVDLLWRDLIPALIDVKDAVPALAVGDAEVVIASTEALLRELGDIVDIDSLFAVSDRYEAELLEILGPVAAPSIRLDKLSREQCGVGLDA